MKKKLFIPLFFLVVATCASAQPKLVNDNKNETDGIYLLQSNKPVAFHQDMTIGVSIDFSQAEIVTFEDDHHTIHSKAGSIESYFSSRGGDYLKNWPKNLEMMTAETCKRLGRGYGAKFVPVSNASHPDYRMVIKIGLFDFGHFVMMAGTKVGGTITKGIVEIYDPSDNLVAVYDMHYIRGLNIAYGHNKRLAEWSIKYVQRLKEALPPLPKE